MKINNLLLVAGTGQNTGKTSLICRLIAELSGNFSVIAIKISPHFHPVNSGYTLVEVPGKFLITRETSMITGKDSSRMLAAGASKVFYIQIEDDNLLLIRDFLNEQIATRCPVICESGGLRKILSPAHFFVCMAQGDESKNDPKNWFVSLADQHFTTEQIRRGNIKTPDFTTESGFSIHSQVLI